MIGEHKGITTAAEWVNSLQEEGTLQMNTTNLNDFLEARAVSWWPSAKVAAFPRVGSMESISHLSGICHIQL
jgi:hypothetical protein